MTTGFSKRNVGYELLEEVEDNASALSVVLLKDFVS